MFQSFYRTLGFLIIVASFVLGWFVMEARQFINSPMNVMHDDLLIVESGSTMKGVAALLHQRGYIDRPAYFFWYARWDGGAEKIQAGEYRMSPGLTPAQLLEKLVTGEVMQYALTVVEGWTFQQMVAAVASQEKLTHTLKGVSGAELMKRLGHPGMHPEGRFQPDTYYFPEGTTDLEFFQRAYASMERVLREAWTNRAPNLPFKTPNEALILASIVEKETAAPSERGQIAGVFVRRLKKGMRLQTDPTVIYGIGKAYDGNIRKVDLLKDTPYNTYTRKGLPPTPIALPGLASILATLHPDNSQAIYFVARGDGTHHFSATLEEHTAAVQRYQIAPTRKRQNTKP